MVLSTYVYLSVDSFCHCDVIVTLYSQKNVTGVLLRLKWRPSCSWSDPWRDINDCWGLMYQIVKTLTGAAAGVYALRCFAYHHIPLTCAPICRMEIYSSLDAICIFTFAHPADWTINFLQPVKLLIHTHMALFIVLHPTLCLLPSLSIPTLWFIWCPVFCTSAVAAATMQFPCGDH